MVARAYVLFEVEPTSGDVALERLTHHSLGGCKVLANEIVPGEIIAHLEADGLENFNAALVELLGETGVQRATTLRIIATA
ncbi:hypothetical protein ACQEV2_00340 [Streptomyces sp. CA-251387]|uniref:hypothetical protein n=1 Tax=Streptomyces sp. CA-251387 TaxID=3240064 RepID=UPI003D8D38A3